MNLTPSTHKRKLMKLEDRSKEIIHNENKITITTEEKVGTL